MIVYRDGKGRACEIVYDTHTEIVPYLHRIVIEYPGSTSEWHFNDRETIYIPDRSLRL